MPTDAELIREWAEKVMNYPPPLLDMLEQCIIQVGLDRLVIANPLANEVLLWDGVDAICKRGYWFRLLSPWEAPNVANPEWSAGFTTQGCTPWNGRMDMEVRGPDRRRAVFMACLTVARNKSALHPDVLE